MRKLNYILTNLTIFNDLVGKIKAAQEIDEELHGFLTSLNPVKMGKDKIIRFEGWLCIPKNEKLRNEVLHETRHSKYAICSCVIKKYQGIERDVAHFFV